MNKQLGMAAVGTEAPDLIDNDIGKTREELIKAQTDHDEAEARFTVDGRGQGRFLSGHRMPRRTTWSPPTPG